MLRAGLSERQFDRQLDAINQRPLAPLYRGAGVPIAELGGKLATGEEAFLGGFLSRRPTREDWRTPHKLPLNLLRVGVRASERAYVATLNRIRADAFDAYVAAFAEGGKPTLEEAKYLGWLTGVTTGRGKLANARLDQAVGMSSHVLFSPRYLLSRMQLISGQPIWGAPTWRTRKLAAAEYARFLGGMAVLYTLASLANDDERITFDPRSADFGKVRFGNTRLDPLAGLAQVTVFPTRRGT
jgi:hypothetical protein